MASRYGHQSFCGHIVNGDYGNSEAGLSFGINIGLIHHFYLLDLLFTEEMVVFHMA